MRAMIIVAAVAAAGCATTPVPADKYARARASIKSAEVMNVDRVPSAAAYLRTAKDELEQAKKMLKDGENEQAEYMLLRAEAAGEAALNLAKETWAKEDAARTIQNVQQMKAQMQAQEGPQS